MTLYKWIEQENLGEAIQEGRNRILDIAEHKLAKKINEEDTTSILFFLKTQGKERGYVERYESKNTNTNTNTNIELTEGEAKLLNKSLEDEY